MVPSHRSPEATPVFWIIQILCTRVGETFADYLNVTLNFGLKDDIHRHGRPLRRRAGILVPRLPLQVTTIIHFAFKLNAVRAFWLA